MYQDIWKASHVEVLISCLIHRVIGCMVWHPAGMAFGTIIVRFSKHNSCCILIFVDKRHRYHKIHENLYTAKFQHVGACYNKNILGVKKQSYVSWKHHLMFNVCLCYTCN